MSLSEPWPCSSVTNTLVLVNKHAHTHTCSVTPPLSCLNEWWPSPALDRKEDRSHLNFATPPLVTQTPRCQYTHTQKHTHAHLFIYFSFYPSITLVQEGWSKHKTAALKIKARWQQGATFVLGDETGGNRYLFSGAQHDMKVYHILIYLILSNHAYTFLVRASHKFHDARTGILATTIRSEPQLPSWQHQLNFCWRDAQTNENPPGNMVQNCSCQDSKQWSHFYCPKSYVMLFTQQQNRVFNIK